MQIDQIPADVGLFSVWLLGLSVGLTACTAACLPFMGTWILGRNGGGQTALRDTAAFATGKILAYSLLGMAAGLIGEWVNFTLEDGVGHWFIGFGSIAAGAWLFWQAKPANGCAISRMSMPPAVMGFALSFTPCAPLAALLVTSSLAEEPLLGLGYGFFFGLGAALTPLFIVLPALGFLRKGLIKDRPWLAQWMRYGAAMVLVVIGLRRLWLGGGVPWQI